ncbi:hypothetical protein [Burkholderia sp. 3C]
MRRFPPHFDKPARAAGFFLSAIFSHAADIADCIPESRAAAIHENSHSFETLKNRPIFRCFPIMNIPNRDTPEFARASLVPQA